MAGEAGPGSNDVVFKSAVVPDVGPAKYGVIRTEDGRLAFARGAVDRDPFADDVVVTDLSVGDAAFVFQILSPQTDGGKWVDLVVPAEAGVAVNDHVRQQPAAISQHDVLAHYAEG